MEPALSEVERVGAGKAPGSSTTIGKSFGFDAATCYGPDPSIPLDIQHLRKLCAMGEP